MAYGPPPGSLIAAGIVVVETSTADGKIGAVLGPRAALAIDGGIDIEEGGRTATALAGLDRVADHLVYTHAHLDHVLGGSAMTPGEVYAHAAAAEHIAAQVPAWSVRFDRPEADITSAIAWPTTTFTEPLTVDVGGREVRLIPTPGHAPGATCVLVPDAAVLFGGDTVVTGIPPSFSDGDSVQFEASLRLLANLDVDVLVPGHGPMVTGRAAVRDAILWAADYLARCRDHVARRLGTEPIDDIVSSAPFASFIGDRLPADRNRMPWRHEQTLRTMARHLDEHRS